LRFTKRVSLCEDDGTEDQSRDKQNLKKMWSELEDKYIMSLGGKNSVDVCEGDRIRLLTPGGGGWGRVDDPSHTALDEVVMKRE